VQSRNGECNERNAHNQNDSSFAYYKTRRKRVTLAKSWCKRNEADSVFGKFLSINEHINPTLLRAEWIAQDMVFVGDES
jgi:hypothetical protein